MEIDKLNQALAAIPQTVEDEVFLESLGVYLFLHGSSELSKFVDKSRQIETDIKLFTGTVIVLQQIENPKTYPIFTVVRTPVGEIKAGVVHPDFKFCTNRFNLDERRIILKKIEASWSVQSQRAKAIRRAEGAIRRAKRLEAEAKRHQEAKRRSNELLDKIQEMKRKRQKPRQ